MSILSETSVETTSAEHDKYFGHDVFGVYAAVSMPKTISVLHVTPVFKIELTSPMPNRWRRFWYRVLLGWEWTEP